MIESIWSFCSRNVWRNASRVVGTSHPYLSGLVSLAVVNDYFNSGLAIKLAPLASVFLTYNTVVFGFTATAIALAIAIPSPTFIRFLSKQRDRTTPFRDFLFILAWNGFVHILAFFIALPIVIYGHDWILTESSGRPLRVYLFFLLWVQLYACFQFLVTTLGVYELGDLYANYVAKERTAEDMAKASGAGEDKSQTKP